MPSAFDPNAAATDSGIFGLPFSAEESRFVLVPVPFDATTSYRDGTRNGPAAVLEASYQVDLFDLDFGRPYEAKIAMLPLDKGFAKKIAQLNREARRWSKPVIEAAGQVEGKPQLRKALANANRLCAQMNELVEEKVGSLIDHGKTPIVLGGDHSTPFGAIRAYARKHPGLGILHIDAHADLRVAFEGFEWSHASIMHNVISKIGPKGGVASLVQVGIRDFGENEFETIRRPAQAEHTRIRTYFDAELQKAKFSGRPWSTICAEIVGYLPAKVYISFDIDGLEPSLCPDTGTPVPGGLSFGEVCELFRAISSSGKTVVGFDLNEVAPSRQLARADWGADWNANVGARILYKMLGLSAKKR